MNQRPSRALRRWTVTVLAGLLTACGGGGGGSGGGDSTPPPTATREVPLALTSANAEAASNVTLAFGELALIFAQMAHDWSAAFGPATGLAIDMPCDQGGTLTLRLIDRDNNQRASAGDQITATLSNCYVRTFDDPLDGTLTIDLAAPTTAGTQEAGTVTMGSRLVLPGTIEVRFEGAVRYEYGADALSSALRVLSASAPLAVIATGGTVSTRDVVTALDARKEVHRDTARTQSRMQYRLASDLVGGSLQITTELPLDGDFNTAPDSGRVLATGAGGAAVTVGVSAGSLVRSFNGVNNALPLTDAATGYLWWAAGVTAPGTGTRGYVTQSQRSNTVVLLSAPAADLRQNPAPLVWQYSRPVTPTQTPPLAFLDMVQAGSGLAWAAYTVPTTVRVDGAQLTITPSGPLKAGARYDLRFVGGLNGPPIQGQFSNPVSAPTFTAMVPDTIRASATAAAPAGLLGHAAALQLNATGSSAPGSAVAGATWRQVSGPALTLANASTLTPTLSITPATTESGTAEFEVEVRNTAGDIDRARTSVAVINDAFSQPAFRLLTSDTGIATWSLGGTGGGSYAHVFNGGAGLDIIAPGARLLMSQPQALAAGQSRNFTEGSGVNAYLYASPGSACISPTNGSYSINELVYGADNVVTRLAMEITVNCPGGLTVRASVRVNSAAPVGF